MKTCNKCNTQKELKLFNKDCSKSDGYQNRCKLCDSQQKKNRRALLNYKSDLSITEKECRCCKENKLVIEFGACKDFKDGYDKDCKICRCSREKDRYSRNSERIKKNTNEYYYENKDKIRITKRKYQKMKMETDKFYVLKRRLRNRLWYALENKGWKKECSFSSYIGCDPETLVKHIESQFTDGMTWENKGKWHVDHIKCLDSAKTEEELLKLCHYTNLQPLWGRDNIAKGTKL